MKSLPWPAIELAIWMSIATVVADIYFGLHLFY